MPFRHEAYASRSESSLHVTSPSAAGVSVTRTAGASPAAAAAKTSPRAVNATLRPSGARASSPKSSSYVLSSGRGPSTDPTRRTSSSVVRPEATSCVQIPKSRSKAISGRASAIEGHSTRPPLKSVSRSGSPGRPASSPTVHRFSAPPRSDMKYRRSSEPPHIAHTFFPPAVTGSYAGTSPSRTSQISASSMCEWPFRHHWLRAMLPRVLTASSPGRGPAAAKNSVS